MGLDLHVERPALAVNLEVGQVLAALTSEATRFIRPRQSAIVEARCHARFEPGAHLDALVRGGSGFDIRGRFHTHHRSTRVLWIAVGQHPISAGKTLCSSGGVVHRTFVLPADSVRSTRWGSPALAWTHQAQRTAISCGRIGSSVLVPGVIRARSLGVALAPHDGVVELHLVGRRAMWSLQKMASLYSTVCLFPTRVTFADVVDAVLGHLALHEALAAW